MSDENFSKSRADKLRARLEGSLKEIVKQAKQAETHLAGLQAKIAKLDKEKAKSEILKMRSKLQGELGKISNLDSAKIKAEVQKARARAQDTLKTVKTQIKAIAEAERMKRRGRSRSE